jgi:hypothetical protein
MLLKEKNITVPIDKEPFLILYFENHVNSTLSEDEVAIRFVVTSTDEQNYHCELGVLSGLKEIPGTTPPPIFRFKKRKLERTDKFTTILLVPTGIGAEIGGHAGDANPVAKLLASVSDTLITHPNVVNASDINELPENGLYVEGSIISQLLMGTIGLQRVRSNRILLIADKHSDGIIDTDLVNAISAARSTIGLNCPKVIQLNPPTNVYAKYAKSGRSVGRIEGLKKLFDVIASNINDIDALALSSTINIPERAAADYFASKGEVVNPWGGVEAMLTHAISLSFNIPTAHAPAVNNSSLYMKHFGIVDPRMSAEVVSSCYIHCVLKGLHRSPKLITNSELFQEPGTISASDISCLVIPDKCIGLPTLSYPSGELAKLGDIIKLIKGSIKELPKEIELPPLHEIADKNTLRKNGFYLPTLKGGLRIATKGDDLYIYDGNKYKKIEVSEKTLGKIKNEQLIGLFAICKNRKERGWSVDCDLEHVCRQRKDSVAKCLECGGAIEDGEFYYRFNCIHYFTPIYSHTYHWQDKCKAKCKLCGSSVKAERIHGV